MTRRLRDTKGTASVEQTGLILLVAAVFAGLLAFMVQIGRHV